MYLRIEHIWSRGAAFLLLASSVFFGSCLRERDHDCPPEYRVTVGIKDKNYANVNNALGMVSVGGQQSFRSFVSNLTWHLRDLSSGVIVAQSGEIVVGDDNPTYAVDLSDQRDGRYVFTVWGNIGAQPSDAGGRLVYPLDAAGNEGRDTYIVSDTLELSSSFDGRYIEMLRAQGALSVQINNLPDSVVKVTEQIYSVYHNLYEDYSYDAEVTVTKSFVSDLHPAASLFTVLAPTVAGKQTVLRLSLYAAGSDLPIMFIPDISLTIKRNEITAVQVDYNPQGGVEVWIMLEGGWVKYHDIDLSLMSL